MKTIEVKSCRECPFINEDPAWDYCGINKKINSIYLPSDKVHPDCPLKKESVTVKVKE